MTCSAISAIKVGTTVYTTRRNPFSNKQGYRKGVVKKIEYDDKGDIKLIWCFFGKKQGQEAYELLDILAYLYLDSRDIEL